MRNGFADGQKKREVANLPKLPLASWRWSLGEAILLSTKYSVFLSISNYLTLVRNTAPAWHLGKAGS